MIPAPLSTKKNLAWNTFGCLLYQGCLWVTTVAVVIFSSSYENSGSLAYAMAIGNIFNPIATYNMRTYQVSDVHNRYSPQEYIGFRVVTIILGLGITSIYVFLTTSNTAFLATVFCYLLFKVDEAFCSVYYAIDQKGARMDYIGLSQGLRGVLLLALFCAGLLLFDDVNVAVILMSLGCVAITVLYDASQAKKFGPISPSISKKTCREMLLTCLPAVLTMLCFGSVVSVSRQMFGNEYGEEALGIYAAIATPTVIIQVASSFLTSPFLVGLSEEWSRGNSRGFVSSLLKIIAGVFVVFLIVLLLSVVFGEKALSLVYGGDIVKYAYLFVPVVIATGLAAYAGFLMDVLVLMRELKLSLGANALALGVSFIASPILERLFYMNGINLTVMCAFGVAVLVDIGVIVKSVLLRREPIAIK